MLKKLINKIRSIFKDKEEELVREKTEFIDCDMDEYQFTEEDLKCDIFKHRFGNRCCRKKEYLAQPFIKKVIRFNYGDMAILYDKNQEDNCDKELFDKLGSNVVEYRDYIKYYCDELEHKKEFDEFLKENEA